MLATIKKCILLLTIVFFFIQCKNEKFVVTKVTAKTSLIDSTLAEVETISKTIAPYKEKMTAEINTILSYTPKSLVRTDGKLESTLGNLLADLSYKRANPIFNTLTNKNIDFAMFNYGGVRAGIAAGNVTNENAFELMPFENAYVVVKLTGKKIEELIKYLIENNIAHPLSKQFRLTITENGYTLTINNQPFDVNKSYFVLTSDYLQTGGDRMDFFKNPEELYKLEYKLRHAIIDEFKSLDTLKANLDGRFKRQ